MDICFGIFIHRVDPSYVCRFKVGKLNSKVMPALWVGMLTKICLALALFVAIWSLFASLTSATA
ncbi:hypothetical protein AXG89_27240 (plasmid) [Burkholderia sp. PAMC 26561]|nr:hypothetical protein AXG89_25445 [Burkholderia sp. PAMC 26561]AME27606.1 hypothetical protein AXG89_27240 [Burkholderia sp. PAMC 26561]